MAEAADTGDTDSDSSASGSAAKRPRLDFQNIPRLQVGADGAIVAGAVPSMAAFLAGAPVGARPGVRTVSTLFRVLLPNRDLLTFPSLASLAAPPCSAESGPHDRARRERRCDPRDV